MNSLIYHAALLLEAIFNRLVRLPFPRTFAALAVAAPLVLLTYATLRYSDAIARATVVVLGSERLVLGLLAVAVLRSAFALVQDAMSARSYRTQSGTPGTLA